MRKFHLLRVEWNSQERALDRRFYLLICAWGGEKTPEAGLIFPSLREPDRVYEGLEDDVDDEDIDDRIIYHQVAATLIAR